MFEVAGVAGLLPSHKHGEWINMMLDVVDVDEEAVPSVVYL